MPRTPKSANIDGQMVLLGTGTSVGVPVLGCDCEVCTSGNPRNNRTRCAAILGVPGGNLLIDTPPDLRMQLLREGLGVVHAVMYTHEHADHLFGLDDLRLMQFYLEGPVPLHCTPRVARRIAKSYDYAFSTDEPTHAGDHGGNQGTADSRTKATMDALTVSFLNWDGCSLAERSKDRRCWVG